MILTEPILLEENRVWRIYRGGALLDRFRGKTVERDDFFPEDWIASATRAVNPGREHIANEGLSAIILGQALQQQKILLADVLKDEQGAESLLGRAHIKKFGRDISLLVKLLDSKVRLPFQTHPDKNFARQHLNSSHGKYECWMILDGREIDGEAPHVFFGFREGVKKQDFEREFFAQNAAGMADLMNKVSVQPGDIFIIPANLPHAIGPGVFLMEIQEPSDHVFQFDRVGSCWNLNDFQVHMNLGERTMLDSIDYSVVGEEVLDSYALHFDPASAAEEAEPILPEGVSSYFRGNFVTSRNLSKKLSSLIIGIVFSGSGRIVSESGEIEVKRGDTFLVPAAAGTVTYKSSHKTEPLRILEALPPK